MSRKLAPATTTPATTIGGAPQAVTSRTRPGTVPPEGGARMIAGIGA